MAIFCKACNGELGKEEILTCSTCKKEYHFACAGKSHENFKKMASETKLSWKCCKTKKISSSSSSADDQAMALDLLRKDLCTQFQKSHNDVMQKLDALVNKVNQVNNDHEEIMKSIQFLNENYNEMRTRIKECESLTPKIGILEKQNADLRHKVEFLEYKMDEKEQKINETKVEIRGIPVLQQHNHRMIVTQIATKIGMEIQEDDLISTSLQETRGPGGGNGSDIGPQRINQTLIASFKSSRVRNDFLDASKKYNKAKRSNDQKINTQDIGMSVKHPIYIQEALTPLRRYLHLQARKLSKNKSYKYIWLKNGITMVKKDDDSRILMIKYLTSLENIL